MLIYDFIADICIFISLVWPYPACALTVTKRKGPFCNLVFYFSASFWTVFVEPGAAPPVHLKISRTKVLCSTSKILCWYFNVLTLMKFAGARYRCRAGFSMGLTSFTSKKVRPPQSAFALMSFRASWWKFLACSFRSISTSWHTSSPRNFLACSFRSISTSWHTSST